jgi:hypothetical protein
MNAFLLIIILLVAAAAEWRVVLSALAAGAVLLAVLGIVFIGEQMHVITAMTPAGLV